VLAGGLAATTFTGVAGHLPASAAPASSNFFIGGTYGANADPSSWEARIGRPLGVRRSYWTASQVSKAMSVVAADIAANRRCSEISFKGPASWYQMARGTGDAWMRDIRARLSSLLAGNNHRVKLIMHHEPENDTGTNDGRTNRGRDNWMRWQNRAANIFAGVERLNFGICLMGYYCFYGNQGSRWYLNNCIPDNTNIKFVSFDLYQVYGTNGRTDWTDFEGSYFAKIGPWMADHNKKWGLSEFGITERALDRPGRGDWFRETYDAMVRHGGNWMDYFNTTLNNTDPSNPWGFTPGDSRELAYNALIRNQST
jgi:hypothetical protein